jgi:hypothetical protein
MEYEEINLQNAKQKFRRRKRKKRKFLLKALIKAIEEGKLDTTRFPITNLSKLTGPHKEYISPRDRSTYNYGYMETSEMLAGTPNVK